LPLEITSKAKRKREMSEGWLLLEHGLIKDNEKLLPKNYDVIGGWVLNLILG
jgi:hypothetical protein